MQKLILYIYTVSKIQIRLFLEFGADAPKEKHVILMFNRIWQILTVLIVMIGGSELLFAQSSQIEEVIVTAEKRDENLQELSQAVTALDREVLDDLNATRLVDLNGLSPGVNIAKNEGFRTVVTIRGVGNEANQNSIANPSVSYHVDGFYVASAFSLQTDLVDIEQIEFIRGPQGTIFGQNSAGGAINVTTIAPTPDEKAATAALTVGNYNYRNFQVSANVPLNDETAIRTSLQSNRHDGFSENVVLDQELDQSDSLSGNLRFLWDINTTMNVHFVAKYFDENTNGSAQKGLYDITPDPRELAQDSHSSYELTAQLYGAIFEWDLNAFHLKYLASSQKDRIVVFRDNDRTDLTSLGIRAPLPAAVTPTDNTQETVTHEIQLVSDAPTTENSWIAGIFYLDTTFDIFFNEKIDFARDGVFDPISVDEILDFSLGDYGFISDSSTTRESISGYFQHTQKISENASLIGGLRYTNDDVLGLVTNFHGRAGTDVLTIESDQLTGRLTLEYSLDDNMMIYGSLTRGFKPGGSNLTYGREDEVALILVQATYDEEIVDVVEAGLKTELFDRRWRCNLAVFSYDYQNLQYQATDPEVFEGGVANIPESRIQGVEVESFAILSDALDVRVNFAWLNTEISALHYALDNVASDATTNELLAQGFFLFGPEIQQARAENIQNLQNNQLAKVPEFTSYLAARYVTSIGTWGNVEGTVHVIHRGEYYHRLFNNPRTDFVENYTIFNLTTELTPSRSNWTLGLAVMNVTDNDGVNARFTDVFGVGATSDELIPPRQFLVTLRSEFQ